MSLTPSGVSVTRNAPVHHLVIRSAKNLSRLKLLENSLMGIEFIGFYGISRDYTLADEYDGGCKWRISHTYIYPSYQPANDYDELTI